MGELDKELIEATINFKGLLERLGEHINPDNIELLLQAFITGFNNGAEAMRDYSISEGLNIKDLELISNQARRESEQLYKPQQLL